MTKTFTQRLHSAIPREKAREREREIEKTTHKNKTIQSAYYTHMCIIASLYNNIKEGSETQHTKATRQKYEHLEMEYRHLTHITYKDY